MVLFRVIEMNSVFRVKPGYRIVTALKILCDQPFGVHYQMHIVSHRHILYQAEFKLVFIMTEACALWGECDTESSFDEVAHYRRLFNIHGDIRVQVCICAVSRYYFSDVVSMIKTQHIEFCDILFCDLG